MFVLMSICFAVEKENAEKNSLLKNAQDSRWHAFKMLLCVLLGLISMVEGWSAHRGSEKTSFSAEDETIDSKLKQFFDTVAGKDGQIDAFELQRVFSAALKRELDGREFRLGASRSMLSMEDRDGSGKLDYYEFRNLWRTVMSWKSNFKTHDADKSGDMTVVELNSALAQLGFKLSTRVLSSIALRYVNKAGKVAIDNYLEICCRINSASSSYVKFRGREFSLDDFIMAVINN